MFEATYLTSSVMFINERYVIKSNKQLLTFPIMANKKCPNSMN